jgi:hypothetical protein
MGIDASGVYRVSGHGREQGRTVPWSLLLKVAASSAHGGDAHGGAREWHGDPRIVRLGYVAAAALRYILPIGLKLLLDASGVAWLEQVFGRPIGEAVDCWVGVHQFKLGLVDEARALLRTLQ